VAIVGFVAAGVALGWGLFVFVPRKYDTTRTRAAAAPVPAPLAGPKIKAELFYVSDDGQKLVAFERDVAFVEGNVEQAREIITAQLAPVSEPLVSPIPAGTVLRGVFIADRGEAYVDLSREVVSNHPGGTLNEMLTVYAIVDALTANLPAVKSVQLLVDGKEAATLAGHVDLERRLRYNRAWIQ
jgi:hypothetical protein